jgi:hypothetical protein
MEPILKPLTIKVSELDPEQCRTVGRYLSQTQTFVRGIGLDPDKTIIKMLVIPKELPSKKNPFSDRLFMGSGLHSVLVSNMLHQRLDDALSWLSGLQQSMGMGIESDPAVEAQAEEEIKAAVKDIQIALLGKK